MRLILISPALLLAGNVYAADMLSSPRAAPTIYAPLPDAVPVPNYCHRWDWRMQSGSCERGAGNGNAGPSGASRSAVGSPGGEGNAAAGGRARTDAPSTGGAAPGSSTPPSGGSQPPGGGSNPPGGDDGGTPPSAGPGNPGNDKAKGHAGENPSGKGFGPTGSRGKNH